MFVILIYKKTLSWESESVSYIAELYDLVRILESSDCVASDFFSNLSLHWTINSRMYISYDS